ncbi:MAG: NUDIX pyrophosphatase [Anaerolineae bacterium]|jgi:dATP pyrophosphohydrolase
MSRSPINVLVYPYRIGDGEFEYALLKRSDAGYWQAVAGGAEGDETPLQAAQRETWEETDISPDSSFLQLDTVFSVPVTEFKDSYLWGEHIYVIPQYCFGVLAQDKQITLSREHTDYKWLKYEDARSLLKYDGCKTALWELDRRLRGLGPRD